MKLKWGIKSFRKSLTRNKIFFEVIVSIILSVSAIYVSVKANQISEAQTRIMEQEVLPQIEVRRNQEYNEATRIYENDVVLVFNHGGRLTDFDFDVHSLLILKEQMHLGGDTLQLLIDGYHNFRGTISGESQGLVYQIDNRHNNLKEKELSDSLLNIGFVEIHSYAQISYLDLFETRHYEYYKVSPGIEKITESEWQQFELLRKSRELKEVFFPKLTASTLIRLLEKGTPTHAVGN